MAELNGVMMQFFHWYSPQNGLWNEVKEKAKQLSELGVTSLWLPPAYKGAGGGYDVGYGTYDLFDLGEFDQKGSIPTKYGTKDEYLAAIKAAKDVGIRIYADAVFNHKLGADGEEEMEATPFNPDNRNEVVGEYQKIKAWTAFNFPGRGDKYSTMKWHWYHFNAIDHNAYKTDINAIYLLKGKQFDQHVDSEKGNFDYLMGCDLDMTNAEVIGELKYWGEWVVGMTGVDGFRFDAVKHVKAEFFREWLDHVAHQTGKDIFGVGEYWSYDINSLLGFIATTNGRVKLFDAPLHHNFYLAGKAGNQYDMRQIFDNSLVKAAPDVAVTLVDNHDSQPLQSLESAVEPWFKPLAYALILLRQGGYPSIFYADYYGAHYKDKGRDGNEHEVIMDAHQWLIDKFLFARQHFAFGEQYDYLDHPNCIGWTRVGNPDHPEGMAVVLSNGDEGTKRMETTKPKTIYIDLTEQIKDSITTDDTGWAEFRCLAGSMSVWIPKPTP
jgi:alpha-amylase